jgi:hypothetical protein
MGYIIDNIEFGLINKIIYWNVKLKNDIFF